MKLKKMEDEEGAAVYNVVARIFPLLRHAGMHEVRQLRCMCVQADQRGLHSNTLTLPVFTGILSASGIRLLDQEASQLIALFGDRGADDKPGSSERINYKQFFQLMGPKMAEV